MSEITYETLTRKERLRLWLNRRGLTAALVAAEIGEKQATVARWFRCEIIPVVRRKRLERYGIPPELLPFGMDLPGGRGRRALPSLLALPPAAADAHVCGVASTGEHGHA